MNIRAIREYRVTIWKVQEKSIIIDCYEHKNVSNISKINTQSFRTNIIIILLMCGSLMQEIFLREEVKKKDITIY